VVLPLLRRDSRRTLGRFLLKVSQGFFFDLSCFPPTLFAFKMFLFLGPLPRLHVPEGHVHVPEAGSLFRKDVIISSTFFVPCRGVFFLSGRGHVVDLSGSTGGRQRVGVRWPKKLFLVKLLFSLLTCCRPSFWSLPSPPPFQTFF